jgi:hypothetical protein
MFSCAKILTMSAVNVNEKESTTKQSEFDAPRWSVLSFDKCEKSNLTYEEAQRYVANLSQKSSGLCIVTDEAANRLYGSGGKARQQTTEQSEDATKHFAETL